MKAMPMALASDCCMTVSDCWWQMCVVRSLCGRACYIDVMLAACFFHLMADVTCSACWLLICAALHVSESCDDCFVAVRVASRSACAVHIEPTCTRQGGRSLWLSPPSTGCSPLAVYMSCLLSDDWKSQRNSLWKVDFTCSLMRFSGIDLRDIIIRYDTGIALQVKAKKYDKNHNCCKDTARRSISVEILSTALQFTSARKIAFEKACNRPIGEWA